MRLAALIVVVALAGCSHPPYVPPELTPEERAQESVLIPTAPTEIRLLIQSEEDFDSSGGEDHRADVAFTRFKPICEIHLRAGMILMIWPATAGARFLNNYDANTLAHELGHCVRGWWHGPYK